MKRKIRTSVALLLVCATIFLGIVVLLPSRATPARELSTDEMQEIIGGYLCPCESCDDPITTCWCHYCGHGTICNLVNCPLCPCACSGPTDKKSCSDGDCCVGEDGSCQWCADGEPRSCEGQTCDDCCSADYNGPCAYCSRGGTIECNRRAKPCSEIGCQYVSCPSGCGTVCAAPVPGGPDGKCGGHRGPCGIWSCTDYVIQQPYCLCVICYCSPCNCETGVLPCEVTGVCAEGTCDAEGRCRNNAERCGKCCAADFLCNANCCLRCLDPEEWCTCSAIGWECCGGCPGACDN